MDLRRRLVSPAQWASGCARSPLMPWNDFGPGPPDVFIGAIGNQTDLPRTPAVWLAVGALIAVAAS